MLLQNRKITGITIFHVTQREHPTQILIVAEIRRVVYFLPLWLGFAVLPVPLPPLGLTFLLSEVLGRFMHSFNFIFVPAAPKTPQSFTRVGLTCNWLLPRCSPRRWILLKSDKQDLRGADGRKRWPRRGWPAPGVRKTCPRRAESPRDGGEDTVTSAAGWAGKDLTARLRE